MGCNPTPQQIGLDAPPAVLRRWGEAWAFGREILDLAWLRENLQRGVNTLWRPPGFLAHNGS